MSYGSNELYDALDSDPIIGILVTTYDGGAEKMIFDSPVLPDQIVGNADTSINFYLLGDIDHRLEYGDFTYTVNCRAAEYSDALELQKAVVDAINRRSNNEHFFLCQSSPVIAPADGTDNYNAPVSVGVKTRIF